MTRCTFRSNRRDAFTLVEILVVITVIGILMGLLLPAVTGTIHSANRNACRNNLKNIGEAVLGHETNKKMFPTGGVAPWPTLEYYMTNGIPWGPERQGLGWPYQILPYVGMSTVYNTKKQVELQKIVVPFYFCPGRRKPAIYHAAAGAPQFGDAVLMDYAGATPGEFGKWDDEGAYWQGQISYTTTNRTFRGVIARTNHRVMPAGPPGPIGSSPPTTFGMIHDGKAFTMLVGEKCLQPDNYLSGDWHDDRGWTDGWDPDTMRSTAYKPMMDHPASNPGETSRKLGFRFGSAHAGAFHAVFCDGSVRSMNYIIDRDVFNCLGDRNDGKVIDETQVTRQN